MSDTAWNLKALSDHVRGQGQNANDPAPKAIRSVSKMIEIFHFNAYATKDALGAFVKEGEPPTEEHLHLIFGVSERQKDFVYARLASEAHLLATLLTARSIFDIFSQVINALLLSPKLTDKACSIHNVRNALPAARLRGELDKLLDSDWFKYVNGFVNLSKHRYMIEHGIQASFVNNAMGIQVGAFSYDGDSWDARSATAVLKGAFEVKNHIASCGRALNAACGVRE